MDISPNDEMYILAIQRPLYPNIFQDAGLVRLGMLLEQKVRQYDLPLVIGGFILKTSNLTLFDYKDC